MTLLAFRLKNRRNISGERRLRRSSRLGRDYGRPKHRRYREHVDSKPPTRLKSGIHHDRLLWQFLLLIIFKGPWSKQSRQM
jgi:hypothetical protein